MKARTDYLTWHEYFMGIVKIAAMRSKDPTTPVGAVIVNNKNQIISTGYNGFPRGLDDNIYPWNRDSTNWLENKYPYVVHAEANAILNSVTQLYDARIYVSLFPCNECAKLIIQAGIKTVYYASDKYDGTKENIASKKMFTNSGVEMLQIKDVEVTVKK